ncbi:MAG: ferritin-like domain-containing protein [Solirubrobacteraceae bacterium]
MNIHPGQYSARPHVGNGGASSRGVTDRNLVGPRSPLVRELTAAYWDELEAVSKYSASAINRDGIRARESGGYLRDALTSHLDHAHRVAIRIRQLHGRVPGADEFLARELRLEPPRDPHDTVSVLTTIVEAETRAVDRYWSIAAIATDARDWITQDLAIQLAREKEGHRQLIQTHLGELTDS